MLDQSDQAFLRSTPQRNEYCPGSLARFFRNNGTPLSLSTMYCGTAFLLGGGPSFNSVDKSLLSDSWVMTLNNAVRSYRGQASCTVDAPSRFSMSLWRDPKIIKFCPVSHFKESLWDNRFLEERCGNTQKWERSSTTVGDCPNVIGFTRNEHFNVETWLSSDSFNWGNHAKHGGGRSVMLPALRILYELGFRTVYLLGVDFEMTTTKRYHFQEQRSTSAINGNMTTYKKLRHWFSILQPRFKEAGFNVFNCNPKSRLEVFPFMSIERAAAESRTALGIYREERTDGMYLPDKEKNAVQIAADSSAVLSKLPRHLWFDEPRCLRQEL